MNGRKRSSSFAITLNHVDFDKTCFGSWCVNGDLVKRLVVAQESHHSALNPESGELMNEDAGKHQHIFVEFKEKYFLTEVHSIVYEFLGGEEDRSINVQVCTN